MSHIAGTIRTLVSIATIIVKETYSSLVPLACYMIVYIFYASLFNTCRLLEQTLLVFSQVLIIAHNKYLCSRDHFKGKALKFLSILFIAIIELKTTKETNSKFFYISNNWKLCYRCF